MSLLIDEDAHRRPTLVFRFEDVRFAVRRFRHRVEQACRRRRADARDQLCHAKACHAPVRVLGEAQQRRTSVCVGERHVSSALWKTGGRE